MPDTLPAKPVVIWKRPLFNEGLGGVAVADGMVVVGDRDAEDRHDVFHGLDAATGERVWTVEYPAEGRLDYGNSPRATPLVHDGRVYLLGAFGHLHCVNLIDGRVLWERHLRHDFVATSELVWGVCSSPLIVDGRLIVNPGGSEASVVALDPVTGDVIWRAPCGGVLVIRRLGPRRPSAGRWLRRGEPRRLGRRVGRATLDPPAEDPGRLQRAHAARAR